MNDNTIIACVGIVCLAALEIAAICTGQDGAYFLPIVAAISGIVGAALGQKSDTLRKFFNK